MSSPKPTIVVVPGSCAPAAVYGTFADHVRFLGYEIEVISLPSVGRRGDGKPPATMQDDAQHIHEIVKKLADAGKTVVIVCHSYGGVPTTESVKGLSMKERGAGNGGVTRLIYATAMAFPVGGSIASLHASGESPALGFASYTDDGYVYISDHAQGGAFTYNLLPAAEGEEASRRMAEHSVMSFAGAVSHAGYLDVPVTYLLATQDKVIPPAQQEGFVKIMQDAGASVEVVRFESDHGWFASRPRSTARLVLKAIDPSL